MYNERAPARVCVCARAHVYACVHERKTMKEREKAWGQRETCCSFSQSPPGPSPPVSAILPQPPSLPPHSELSPHTLLPTPPPSPPPFSFPLHSLRLPLLVSLCLSYACGSWSLTFVADRARGGGGRIGSVFLFTTFSLAGFKQKIILPCEVAPASGSVTMSTCAGYLINSL